MNLWPHQERYVIAGRDAIRKGYRAILFVLPTGAGKTVFATALAQNHFGKRGKVLWIVHRAELIKQAAASLRRANVPCGIIAPWAPRTYEDVQVASIQTLLARDLVLDGITMLVIDEAHHIVADTYLTIRKQYPDALVVGLTATPGRADNRGLKGAFDFMVAEVQPKELIALHEKDPTMGLVPCTVIGPRVAVENLCDYPVDAYRSDCDGRQAIVFVGSVKYAAELARAFTVAGYPARSVDGAMTDADRERTIAEYNARKLRVLVSVMVLTEGFDAPETSAVILASKVSSEVTLIQKTGRGMRCFPGKKDCIILDLYGSCHALHILPDSDRAYSLEGQAVRSLNGEMIDMPQCPQCGMVFECGMWTGGPCPRCGWVRPAKPNPRVVYQEKIALQESNLAKRPTQQNRAEWLRAELIKQKGATGGILGRYAKRFPFPPQLRWPNTAIRNASGFNQCLAEERAERERRNRSPLFDRELKRA